MNCLFQNVTVMCKQLKFLIFFLIKENRLRLHCHIFLEEFDKRDLGNFWQSTTC